MLIRQAASQIDMQITLTVQRIFSSSRARRIPAARVASEELEKAGDGLSASRAIELVRSLHSDARAAIIAGKQYARFLDLARLKERIFDGLSAKAGVLAVDPEAEKVFEKSKTHNVLLSA
jgi:hypothetical protein